jgi:hypothetical protein
MPNLGRRGDPGRRFPRLLRPFSAGSGWLGIPGDGFFSGDSKASKANGEWFSASNARHFSSNPLSISTEQPGHVGKSV